MNIIIPCTGLGKRFLDAGYNEHKSLLLVDNNELVIHKILKMFDKSDNFIVIANQFNYDNLLNELNNAIIIKSVHESKGPVNAILAVKDRIEHYLKDEPVIVVYSDFYQTYDYDLFKEFVSKNNSDGCVISYTGYHPHFKVSDNKYASSELDSNNNIISIKEKYCSTEMENGFHSSGMYYFKSLDLMVHYFNKLIEKDININGEFYVSMVYNEMIRDGLKVTSFNDIHHFLQLGTPKDYEYFVNQKEKFDKLNNIVHNNNEITQVMLMAGRSERFIREGYDTPKPFLNVYNNKMHLFQNDFIHCKERIFITADDYEEYIESNKQDYVLIEKNKIGPAYSYLKGAESIKGEVVITSCDILANYLTEEFYSLKPNYDVIIFSTKNHNNANQNPYSYSWVEHSNNDVIKVSLKKPLTNIEISKQSLLIGSFYVKNNEIFIKHLKSFLQIEKPNNDEYFIDDFMNYLMLFGYNIGIAEVDGYYSFGTPVEYLESNYWLSYFTQEKDNGSRN